MANNINQMQSEILPPFLKQAIDKEIKRVTEEELEAAQKRINERKGEVVAGVILQVERLMRVQTMGTDLIITVKLKE